MESAASDKETSSSRTAAIASKSGSAEKDNEGMEVGIVSHHESIAVRRSHRSGAGVVAGLKITGLIL